MVNSTNIESYLIRRVVEAREAAGMSQAELARELGLSQSGYNVYEKHGRFSAKQVMQLSEIFSRPITWFFGWEIELSGRETELLSAFREIGDPDVQGVVLMIAKDHARIERKRREF